MSADQLTHLIRHAAAGAGEAQPFRYGYIATYDPQQHRVRCIIPSLTDQDGTPLLSAWMPLGTPYATDGAGVQVIYHGGATADNPTAGEQCLIVQFDPRRGVAAVPCLFYHASSPPPATNLPTQQDGYPTNASPVAAGDVIIAAPSQQQGGANSVIRVRQSGNIEIWCAGQLTANVIGNLTTTVSNGSASVTVSHGNATVTASGTATIAAAAINLCAAVGDTLQALCMDALRVIFNTHTHSNGNTGPPDQQAAPTTSTSIVKAE